MRDKFSIEINLFVMLRFDQEIVLLNDSLLPEIGIGISNAYAKL